jgi:uncharacterized protein YeaO (DUF488 family)
MNATGDITIEVKRVYEQSSPEDGLRVLVDRLWPRGVSRKRAAAEVWAKDLAPSTEARRAFDHRAKNLEAFRGRYLAELNASDRARELAEELMAGGLHALPHAHPALCRTRPTGEPRRDPARLAKEPAGRVNHLTRPALLVCS